MPIGLRGSASYRSKTPRDGYIRGSHPLSDVDYYDVKPVESKANPAGAAFRSKSSRDSYIQKRDLPDVSYALPSDFDVKQKAASGCFRSGSPRQAYGRPRETAEPQPIRTFVDELMNSKKGTCAFRSSSVRGSHIQAAANRFVDATYDFKGIGEQAAAQRGKTQAAFRGGSGRDSYIRPLQHQLNDVQYDVPGMAQSLPRTGRWSRSSTPRGAHLHTNLVDATYDLKGMGDVGTGRYPKIRPGKSERDSYIHKSDHFNDLSYDVPGMGDLAVKQRGKLSYGFRNGGDRHSYIKTIPQLVDAVYDVKGIGASAQRSPSASYRSKTPRDGYMKNLPKFVDVVYDIPGMGDLSRMERHV